MLGKKSAWQLLPLVASRSTSVVSLQDLTFQDGNPTTWLEFPVVVHILMSKAVLQKGTLERNERVRANERTGPEPWRPRVQVLQVQNGGEIPTHSWKYKPRKHLHRWATWSLPTVFFFTLATKTKVALPTTLNLLYQGFQKSYARYKNVNLDERWLGIACLQEPEQSTWFMLGLPPSPITVSCFLKLFMLASLQFRKRETAGFLGNFSFGANNHIKGQPYKESWQRLPSRNILTWKCN